MNELIRFLSGLVPIVGLFLLILAAMVFLAAMPSVLVAAAVIAALLIAAWVCLNRRPRP
jgi:hypothetical protein